MVALVQVSSEPLISWGALLQHFWPVAAVSLAVALAATPICRYVALRKGIVDRPDDFLKPHKKPIPYLGGVAVCLGWLAGIAVGLGLPNVPVRIHEMLGITAAGLAIMLVGLFDDLRVMRPVVKLSCNIVVAIWLLFMGPGDELVDSISHLVVPDGGLQERWLELVYTVPVMLLIVVGACNAANLIDGMDGLCAGVSAIIFLGFCILAFHLRQYSVQPVENERIILSLAMMGAAVGFLPFNRNPAKIFLGDAGSMLLGLNAAVIILLFAEAQKVRWMIGALMVFGLPTADMLLTLVRRWRNGRPLMQGDRSHFYDQLHDRGFTVRQVVAISYALTLAFVLVGTSVIFLRTRYAILVYAMVTLLVILGVWKFDMVSIEGRSRGSATAGAGSAQPAGGPGPRGDSGHG